MLKKKTKAGGITIPDVSLYYKAAIIKGVYYRHKKRRKGEWHRIENREMDPQMYGQLNLGKAGKSIQWKKDRLFSKWCWEGWTATCRRMKQDQFLTPCINSKWMKDLNVREETIKTLEKNTGHNLFDLGYSKFYSTHL